MSTGAEPGGNRTGIATAPKRSEEMIAGTAEFRPDSHGDERGIATERSQQTKRAERIGSVPPPPLTSGIPKTPLARTPAHLIDKLGERLAFERMAVRLYEVLLSKFDALGGFDGGPSRIDLERILRDEFRHFRMLEEAVAQVGADPTVLTPSADFHATLHRGALDVLVEPRTTFCQCLEAMLVLELVDDDSWSMLSALAERVGQRALAERFRSAHAEEAEHLASMRRWLAAVQRSSC